VARHPAQNRRQRSHRSGDDLDDLVSDFTSDQRERELQMVGFLNQAPCPVCGQPAPPGAGAGGRVQASLLPNSLPELPAGSSPPPGNPLATSGDFYDFVACPTGGWVW
jgi:hypothetical protein